MSRKADISPGAMVSGELCTGCGACVVARDRKTHGLQWDAGGQLKPVGPAPWMEAGDERFARLCPFSPRARDEDAIAAGRFPQSPWIDRRIGRFESAYAGHVSEPGFRREGSSGGMVSWVAAELLRRGLVDGVAHVVPGDGPERFFGYRLSRSVDAVRAGSRSRYYPVEMSQVLEEMRHVPGRYAVVGVPCFIKAVHLLKAEDPVLDERIAFTLGLFCGHMKSRHMVESFAWQMGMPIEAVERVEYRLKDPDRPANWYTAHLAGRDGRTATRDWWHLVDGDWGSGFFQNPACDYCDDVVAETADISFGDAWVEPYSSDGRGTNVVVVRSPLLHGLVETAIAEARLALRAVDADFIAETQAAGLRHRREGLAYRLALRRRRPMPRKRVSPDRHAPTVRRRLVYRLRRHISRWSARMFRLAKALGMPRLFIAWGRAATHVYQAAAYSRGRLGRVLDRIDPGRARSSGPGA